MRYDISPEKIEEQIGREEAQRAAALGRRFALSQDGFLGPVISRWINSAVSPISERARRCAEAYSRRDMQTFGRLLDTQTFGLAAAYDTGSPEYLEPILKWCLRGSSPGRLANPTGGSIRGGHDGSPLEGQSGGGSLVGTTFCEDLVLATIGRTISDLAMRDLGARSNHASSDALGLSLASVLSNAAMAARETALGQFISMVQGAEAMKAVRRDDKTSWAQRKRMDKVGRVLASQVRHALASEAKGEINLEHVGARTIVRVIDPRRPGTDRRVSLKAEDLGGDDWALLNLAVFPKGEADPAKNAWITFAMLVLCAAQVEHGWFDLSKEHSAKALRSKRSKGRTRYLILAEKPRHHLKSDLARWVSLGFQFDPMLIPPPDGTYLTFQTKAVTGRNGPHGWKTHGEGTTAWELAGDVMAGTPWQVASETLSEINAGNGLTEMVHANVPEEITRRLILGAYSRDAIHEEIYLPLYMDFRGRIYPRTTWVTYQGGDLQKGLLRFPRRDMGPVDEAGLALHVTGLLGFDKMALPERLKIFRAIDPYRDSLAPCEDPVQLWTTMNLLRVSPDQIPVQIDGTCNGLQHLSAMFRDETAAPWVNLSPASYSEPPSDLYSAVAEGVARTVAECAARGESWAMRLVSCGATINRSVCKRPVMVLPYGGTMVAIEEGVTEGLLGQNGINGMVWKECLRAPGIVDPEAIAGGYLSFRDRPINEHPLFHADVRKLAKVVYDAIRAVIPKAMAAMDAFRQIAGCVGDRSLEWSNGVGPNPMWIVHAYPKSERRTTIFRGFHLPNSVRGLAMKCGRDEVNPTMHRTGIVANFIHSQDAAHLVETMKLHRDAGGTSFGANHDCLYGRPSEIVGLNGAVRAAFAARYMRDPLENPVRLRSNEKVEEYPSWYTMAKAFGVQFPEKGRWDPNEVLKSAWFFS